MEEKEKIQKIRSIIEREIEKELVKKQDEISDISGKIKTILVNLELLKYVVAVSYYDQNSTLTPKKVQEEQHEDEKSQTNIHPCIKKLLPFRSNYNKSLGTGPTNSLQGTQNNKKENGSETGPVEIKKEMVEEPKNNIKLPQYIPPLPNSNENVEIVNSARGNVAKDRYRIIIGNVSKWLSPDTREDNSTHKWMIYIRNKDDSKDITQLIKKVRYFLHESYKPHDIIDVTKPFHLTRRGWGEFPIRVQLHFINSLNKPVDIIHNLKLDMTCSGVQMLGAETVVDVCLHQNGSVAPDKNTIKQEAKWNGMKEEIVKEKEDVFDGALLTNIAGINPCPEVTIKKEIEDEVEVKVEAKDDFNSPIDQKLEEMKAAIFNSRRFLLDRRKAMKIIEIEHNYLAVDGDKEKEPLSKFTNSILKVETLKNCNVVGKTLKNGTIVKSIQINQIINKRNQDRLNKIEIISYKSEEEVFKTLKSVVSRLETETQSKYCLKAIRHMYLVNVVQRAHATKLKTVEHLIRWFVQRWPIITKLATDSTYKNVLPFSCPTEEQFFKYNIGKQRSSEWFRAKAIQKVLKTLKTVIPINEEIWSTKQILLWCRFHGYSPSSFEKITKNESSKGLELNGKRVKSNDSSSDSNDGFEYCNKKSKTGEDKQLFADDRKKNFKRSRRKELSNESLYKYVDYKDCNTYTEPNDSLRFGYNEFRTLEPTEECEIDVVSIDIEPKESPSKKKDAVIKIVTAPSSQMPVCKFVCETARQIGVKITEEEIIDGVCCDSVSRVLSQCLTTFLEEIVRKSFAQGWMRNKEKCPESLEVNDVLTTLIEHPQFDIFTNKGLGQPLPEKSEI